MTTFFSVDVETSATDPWNGYLLTVGIQPVRFKDGTAWLAPERCYVRIDRYEELLATQWDEPGRSDTYAWWCEQNEEAQNEAFRDHNLVRHEPTTAAMMIVEFVNSLESEQRDRIFVANPVSFDKMWLDQLFVDTGIPNPFHYQSLCLRSMKFGLRKQSLWGASRDNHDPKVPHHAFHDAYAQALDLLNMLAERDNEFVMDDGANGTVHLTGS